MYVSPAMRAYLEGDTGQTPDAQNVTVPDHYADSPQPQPGSRDLFTVGKDTAVAAAQGLASMPDDIANLVGGEGTSNIAGWLENLKSDKLKAQEAIENQRYEQQKAQDEASGASEMTQFLHGLGHAAHSPLQSAAQGLGWFVPSLLADTTGVGEAATAAKLARINRARTALTAVAGGIHGAGQARAAGGDIGDALEEGGKGALEGALMDRAFMGAGKLVDHTIPGMIAGDEGRADYESALQKMRDGLPDTGEAPKYQEPTLEGAPVRPQKSDADFVVGENGPVSAEKDFADRQRAYENQHEQFMGTMKDRRQAALDDLDKRRADWDTANAKNNLAEQDWTNNPNNSLAAFTQRAAQEKSPLMLALANTAAHTGAGAAIGGVQGAADAAANGQDIGRGAGEGAGSMLGMSAGMTPLTHGRLGMDILTAGSKAVGSRTPGIRRFMNNGDEGSAKPGENSQQEQGAKPTGTGPTGGDSGGGNGATPEPDAKPTQDDIDEQKTADAVTPNNYQGTVKAEDIAKHFVDNEGMDPETAQQHAERILAGARNPDNFAEDVQAAHDKIFDKGDNGTDYLKQDASADDIAHYINRVAANGQQAPIDTSKMSPEVKEAVDQYTTNRSAYQNGDNEHNIGQVADNISKENFDKLNPYHQHILAQNTVRPDLGAPAAPKTGDLDNFIKATLFSHNPDQYDKLADRDKDAYRQAVRAAQDKNQYISQQPASVQRLVKPYTTGKVLEGRGGRKLLSPGVADVVDAAMTIRNNRGSNTPDYKRLVQYAYDRYSAAVNKYDLASKGERGKIRVPHHAIIDPNTGRPVYRDGGYDINWGGTQFDKNGLHGLSTEAHIWKDLADKLSRAGGMEPRTLDVTRKLPEDVQEQHKKVIGNSFRTGEEGNNSGGDTGGDGGGDGTSRETVDAANGKQTGFIQALKAALAGGKDINLSKLSKEDRAKFETYAKGHGISIEGDTAINPFKSPLGKDDIHVMSRKVSDREKELESFKTNNKYPKVIFEHGNADIAEKLKEAGYNSLGKNLWVHGEGENSRPFGSKTPQGSLKGKTLMVSGSRSVKDLPAKMKTAIEHLVSRGVKVVVGDAPGVDAATHSILNKDNATVYHVGDTPRNTIDGAKTESVKAHPTLPAAERYALRDKVMADKSDGQIALWDGKSMGTLRNIWNGVSAGKQVRVFDPEGNMTNLNTKEAVLKFYENLPKDIQKKATFFDPALLDESQKGGAHAYLEGLGVPKTTYQKPALKTLVEQVAEPDELHKDLVEDLPEDLRNSVSKVLRDVFGKVSKPLKAAVKLSLESKDHQINRNTKSLLDADGNINTHIQQAVTLALMDSLHNLKLDGADEMVKDNSFLNPSDYTHLNMNTVIDHTVRTARELLGIRDVSDKSVQEVNGPIEMLAKSTMQAMQQAGMLDYATRETRKNGKVVKKQLYIRDIPILKSNGSYVDLPASWFRNMAADTRAKMRQNISLNGPFKASTTGNRDVDRTVQMENDKKYHINNSLYTLLKKLGATNLAEAFMPADYGQNPNVKSVNDAKKNNILRSFNILRTVAEGDGHAWFRAGNTLNGRDMYKGTTPQSNKLLRSAMSLGTTHIEGWDGKLTDLPKMWGLTMAQALGVKIERLTHNQSLQELPKLLKKNAPVIDAIHNVLYGSGRPEPLVKAMQETGTSAHALHALTDYVVLRQEGKIDSGLTMDVDGITNGLAGVLTMFADPHNKDHVELLKKAGVFIDPGKGKESTIRGKAAMNDLYRTALAKMSSVHDTIGERSEGMNDLLYKILEYAGFITKDEKGVDQWDRDFLKQPLQQANYFSGREGISNTIMRDIFNAAIEMSDRGKLKESDLNRLGMKWKNGHYAYTSLHEMKDLSDNVYYRMGTDVYNAISAAIPRDVEIRARQLGALNWVKSFLSSSLHLAMHRDTWVSGTEAEQRAAMEKTIHDGLWFEGNGVRVPYMRRVHTNVNTYRVAPMVMENKDGAIWTNHFMPSADLFDPKTGDASRGPGVAQIQFLSDRVAMAHAALSMDGWNRVLQIYDGARVLPDEAIKLANTLNEGFATLTQNNPLTDLFESRAWIKKAMQEVEKNSALTKQLVDGLTTWSRDSKDPIFSGGRDLIDTIERLYDEQENRIAYYKNKKVSVGQFNVGGTGDGKITSDIHNASEAVERIQRETNTRLDLNKLQDQLTQEPVKDNPAGHAASRLIEANRKTLEQGGIHTLEKGESLEHTLSQYTPMTDAAKELVKNFDASSTQGIYVPGINDGHGVIFVKKSGDPIKDNQTMLHEITHALITNGINSRPVTDPAKAGLIHARTEIMKLNLPDSHPARAELDRLKSYQRMLMDQAKKGTPDNPGPSPDKMLNEFAASFLESPELLKAGLEMKGSPSFVERIKSVLSAIGKLIFGKNFNWGKGKGSLTHEVFEAIADMSQQARDKHVDDSLSQAMNKVDTSNTQEHMWDDTYKTKDEAVASGLRDTLEVNAKAMNDFEATRALNNLKDTGWSFDPAQERLFLTLYNRLVDSNNNGGRELLREYAPAVKEYLKANGPHSLGTSDFTKKFLVLTQTHGAKFGGIKAQNILNKVLRLNKSATAHIEGVGDNVHAWDNSNILKGAETFMGVTRRLDAEVVRRLKEADIEAHKTHKTAMPIQKHIDLALNNYPKLLDTAKMPEAVRELLKAIAPVMTSERPQLYAIRQWKYALDKSRQLARTKIPEVLKGEFKNRLSRNEHRSLIRAASTDFYRNGDWREIINGKTPEGKVNMTASAKAHADRLALHLATGENVHNLHANADIIAKKFGGDAKDIDKYVGYKAYSLLPKEVKEDLKNILKRDGKALDKLLGYHKDLQDRNAAQGNWASRFNRLKGFIPNEYQDDGLRIAAVERGGEEYKKLKALGFSEIGNVKRNGGEIGPTLVMMSGRTSGNMGSNQGAFCRTNFTVGGYNQEHKSNAEFPLGFVSKNTPYTTTGGTLRPIFDGNGKITHYERQLELPKHIKYSKHDDVFQSLGTYEGRVVEMGMRDAMNSAQLQRLKEAYDNADDKARFVNLATTTDPIYKQAFNSLPEKTIQEAQKLFGRKDFFPVQKTLINDVIGYKKASIGDIFTGDTRVPPKVQKKIVDVAHLILGEKAYQHLLTAENLAMEGAGYAQRIIAVASIRIPLRNMCMDILQLMSAGISLKTITQRGISIAKDAKAYNDAQSNMYKYKLTLASDASEKEKELARANMKIEEERVKNLKTYPLIKAGMYSVVDDSLSPNLQSKGVITPYIQGAMDQMPAGFSTVANNLFATRESKLFRTIQQGVETTDFIARVLTYENNVRKVGHEAAVQKAMDAFVDFNRAKGRTRDYLESVGLMWFWNTKLKSLGIATQMMRDNPLLSLMYSGLIKPEQFGFMHNLSTPVADNIVGQLADGSIMSSFGFGGFGSMLTMNPVMELFS